MKFTNNSNIPLGLAVWLVGDDYDYHLEPNYISATTLLKPLKQIILSRRINQDELSIDIEELISTSMGSSFHTAIEYAWKDNYKSALKTLGYPDKVIDAVRINPDPKTVTSDDIPVYIEQRAIKEFNGFKVGGKFDLVIEGILHDNKSTSAYTWMYGTKDEDYALQGSIYKWLHPDKVKEDFIRINFIFTDWNKISALSNPKYPKHRCMYKDIPLLSNQEIEHWIEAKLNLIKRYQNASEDEIPDCTDEELWRTETKFKYFADASKTNGKSTKNFTSQAEANQYWLETKKGKGTVIAVPGEPRRCKYCNVYSICQQRKRYFKDD